MRKHCYATTVAQVLVIALIAVTPSFGQGMPGGMMGDGAMGADMQLFHQLFEHRADIDRTVIAREDGIETVTESKNPEVTRLLQAHVASMLVRVKKGQPVHQRDPLFAELFKHADQIAVTHEPTSRGVRIVETSKDA